MSAGIPEMKCFLNGLGVENIVSMRTLICRVIGTVFSVSSGLPLGKEGPMVHAGAIVAAVISQGTALSPCAHDEEANFRQFQDFRNDKERRDFVACGAAAGVAAAFGAPIGGVLFSLEEGSSFWSTKLTWRCFFCAMATVFTAILVNSAGSKLGQNAMFSFGEFFMLSGEKSNYFAWEMFLFVLVGVMGGLIGAGFVHVNKKLSKLRYQYMQRSSILKFIDVIVLVMLMTFVMYFLPYFFGECVPLPSIGAAVAFTDQEKTLVSKLVPLYCPADTHYNELASLFLTDGDTAIKQVKEIALS